MKTMQAVLLTGHGGYEALGHRADVPVPQPRAGEVLIRVAAAGINNTDINTRTAQYTVAPSRETYAVDCDWSDAEPAAIPCAYSTAENMLHRANVGAETVLITVDRDVLGAPVAEWRA